ncbi:hypothetical protein BQ8420_13815 [Nocardiopsis sp. JB363]|nr:hypothetical protein BQ8420_13815 [Nocardiopsis sp. JB363]
MIEFGPLAHDGSPAVGASRRATDCDLQHCRPRVPSSRGGEGFRCKD